MKLAPVSLRPPPSISPLYSFFNPLKFRRSLISSQFAQRLNYPRKLSFSASASGGKNDGRDGNSGIDENESKNGGGVGGGGGGGGNGNGNGNGRPRLNLKWVDLLLDPDPANVVAVRLTGVLAWTRVQVLWQNIVISTAILLAALKYSFVAALLIFILIALL